MTIPSDEPANLIAQFRLYERVFENLCQIKADEQAKKLDGPIGFLQEDVVANMMETLADTAVYCRKQFIKLMILQEILQEKTELSDDGSIELGIETFKAAGDD